MKMKIQRLALPAIVCLTALNAHADISLNARAQIREVTTPGDSQLVPLLSGPRTIVGDETLPDGMFALLLQLDNPPILTVNTVNGDSVFRSALGIYTADFTEGAVRSEIYVDGSGSHIEIGSGSAGTGNIVLRGKGDFDITNGGVVNWSGPNECNGGFLVCDILIGRSPASNTGIRVIGAGSLLDNFNTGGRLFVGADPKPNGWTQNEPVLDTTDFLIAQNGGLIRSYGASVGKGFEGPVGGWHAGIGYVRGTVLVDNGTWLSQSLNIGEGDGGSGNVFIVNGGLIDITTDQVDGDGVSKGGFYIGQTRDGVPTAGPSNLLVVDGLGSTLIADNNSGADGASRIANGFVTVQNDGAILLDSSFLLVSGKSGASLSTFNTTLADDVGITPGLSNINLDVLSGGSVTITDTDLDPISVGALIIGQTPDSGPTQSASVRVSGIGSNVTVDNVSKIPLATELFGIPVVSNIGTGTLTVEDGGSVTFNNGDFVIAARAGDDAEVFVDNSTLTADRVVVGWKDFEAGVVSIGASFGVLELTDGVIEGDVVVDDNGELRGEGTINGTLFLEGGIVSGGFSPGTITVESLVLRAGELVMELALNADGSINTALSDSIVATTGTIDLSGGTVMFELSSADPATISLAEIVDSGEVLLVSNVFESSEDVVLTSYNVTAPDGSITDSVLDQQVQLVSFDKSACKKGGWRSLYRPDGSGFKNQGRCIRYVNTGK